MKNKPKRLAGRPSGQTVSIYRKIVDRIILNIENNTWPEGFQLPSFIKLADTFSVGEQTIRRVLDCLAQEKRIVKNARHQWIVKKSELAFSFQSNTIALLTTVWLGNFWNVADAMNIRKGIEIALALRHKQIRIFFKNELNAEMRTIVIPRLKDAELDGILLYGHFTKKCLQQYSALNLPVVRVDAPVPAGIPISSVSVDNVVAAKDAVMRMVQLGHRRIAFCRFVVLGISEVDPDSQARQEGFLAGLKECGIKNGLQDIYSYFSGGDNSAALSAIFKTRPRYTAVICVDRGVTLKVEEAALNAGLTLPRDLSLVTFDAVGADPKFTGPHTDFERIGQEAAKWVLSHTVQNVLIPTIWYEGTTLVKAPKQVRKI